MNITPKLIVAKIISESNDVNVSTRIKYLKELKTLTESEMITWLLEKSDTKWAIDTINTYKKTGNVNAPTLAKARGILKSYPHLLNGVPNPTKPIAKVASKAAKVAPVNKVVAKVPVKPIAKKVVQAPAIPAQTVAPVTANVKNVATKAKPVKSMFQRGLKAVTKHGVKVGKWAKGNPIKAAAGLAAVGVGSIAAKNRMNKNKQ